MAREDWNPRARHQPQGGLVFAGVLLVLAGAWQVFIGYAIASGDAFLFSGGYWYQGDNAAWGWVNLVIGAAALTLGLGLIGRSKRLGSDRIGQTLTLGVAVMSATNQFFLASQYPLWTSVVIAVDIFIIWAVTTRARPAGRESADYDDQIVG